MATNMVGTPNEHGWTLYDPFQGGTHHPEVEAERRRNAEQDAARRGRLPEWEARLPGAVAEAQAKQAAVDAAGVALDAARAANARKYKLVTGGQALRDPHQGKAVIWLDDERTEPERTRRKLAEQVLEAAQAELTQAVGRRDWLAAEIALIKGTVPWSA